ncbi:hypothetical protein Pcinc_003586 [Petrolisthes cinctipes]|uniref:Uncharacterized protein n=1 Tax=Petrolisthes cinctipes TaxID=88211 RepID=A0AAE1GIQ0_PETCI|nr:hypothetical protein Pcinc_003586 [Petrolisthes cinctipes]
MAPHSTDPGGAHMPPPRPPDLPTPTTGVKGINIIAYLDHWVTWDTSHELTAKAVSTATSLLSNLGFLIMS